MIHSQLTKSAIISLHFPTANLDPIRRKKTPDPHALCLIISRDPGNLTQPTQRLARGLDGDETRTRTQRGAEWPGSHSSCAQRTGTEGCQCGGRGRRRAADAPLEELTIEGAHATGAQSDGQLKTPDGRLGPIAEHAHGGAARLRSSHGRGRGCGAEQMKTEFFGKCCSITPNACMLKRDLADGEVRSPAKNDER
ncbi:hypothetical protein NDU88_004317 [Pleurodeles waltl]|uniref:Uncharacterized protein n=1 Tax=Pleurodeles waltl TaxID=8319 RepID=A0AAV7VFV9_PLEWA|nr:hypothetical protein NDU88_004317 [Pleurodeles waltl]